MPKRTNEFQKLVYLIQEQLRDRPDTIVTESKYLKDRISQYKREVDIVVECTANGVAVIIAFECNGEARGADIEWVEQMIAKHANLSNKLVLVSKGPFTPQAIDKAQLYGIDTVVLSLATNTDWSARIDQYHELLFTSLEATVQNFAIEHDIPHGAPQLDGFSTVLVANVSGGTWPFSVWVNAMIDSKAQESLQHWYSRPVDQRKEELTGTMVYVPVPGEPITLIQNGHRYSLAKLTVTVMLRFGSAPIKMRQTEFKGARVVHGKAKIVNGGDFDGHTVQIAMTERPGQAPKVVTTVSHPRYANTPIVSTFTPADKSSAGKAAPSS